jgi:hypothetical protein
LFEPLLAPNTSSVLCHLHREWYFAGVEPLQAELQGGVMSKKPSKQGKSLIINDRGLAFAIYVLYFFGYVTGITTLIGVMIAYLQKERSPRVCTQIND